MNLKLMAPVGSSRVVVVGAAEVMRGRPAEFRHKGLSVTVRATGLGALAEVARDPDCVAVVSTDLPDESLFELVEVLRSLARVPVIAGITPGTDERVISDLLDWGVATTVMLPATPATLADAMAATRLPRQRLDDLVLRVGSLMLDNAQHRVTWFEREVALAPKEFEMLKYLMSAHPRLVPIPEMVDEFERGQRHASNRVWVTAGKIRRKVVAAAPTHESPIETVHRLGVRLRP